MPLKIVQKNIVDVRADAIVNSTNSKLIGLSGADLAIHQAAGERMEEACRGLKSCGPGEIRVTPGYDLKCRYVFHTKVPAYQADDPECIRTLRACYQNALNQALGLELRSIAFPIIGAGHMGYPKGLALSTAMDVIRAFLEENDLLIWLVIQDLSEFELCGPIFDSLDAYMNEEKEPSFDFFSGMPDILIERCLAAEAPCEPMALSEKPASRRKKNAPDVCLSAPKRAQKALIFEEAEAFNISEDAGLDELINRKEETFQETLFRMIDEKQLSGSACYKRANIDRKLYSKIQCDRDYHPLKKTVLAFSVALELSLEETELLLMKAGYAFSNADRRDRIIRFFIENRHYDVYDINQALFKYDQPLIG